MSGAVRQQVEAFLGQSPSYGLPAGLPVTRIDTHISIIFLIADKAYKLKKPVDFGYLDFTSAEKRRAACENELMLNRRTAPELYLRCVPVCEAEAGLTLDGDPEKAIDWLVEMRRFDQDMLFASLAESDSLTEDLVTGLAEQVAAFHDQAEVRRNDGGAARFGRVLDSNLENFAPFERSVYAGRSVSNLDDKMRAALRKAAPLLDRRKAKGWVRHCHGDLHLANVAVIDGKPTPFDCIEFNDDFARVDVLYDLAFLLMDLAFRAETSVSLLGFASHALNAYLTAQPVDALGDTLEGLSLLPLFMACRAAVRSHVAARATVGAEPSIAAALAAQACAYFDFASRILDQPTPVLWAVGGLSGTGKTHLAHRLAPSGPGPLGAVHLRTDVIRKRLARVGLRDRLPSGSYTREASDTVYAQLYEYAGLALDAGQSVVCDGVFAAETERRAIEAVAADRGIPFTGAWLSADLAELEGRVTRRAAAAKDASDATAEIVRVQAGYDLGQMTWQRIDASGPKTRTLSAAFDAFNVTGT